MTPLHDAVLRKDTEIVKVLIKFGANPTIRNCKDDKSPIDQASDKEDILQVLKTSSYLHNNEIKPVVNGIKETEADNQHHTDEINNFQEVSSVASFPPTSLVLKKIAVELATLCVYRPGQPNWGYTIWKNS